MRIVITNASGKPIYEQIKEQVRSAILSDELHEGDVLPSIRQLARDLKISVITTTRAYSDLEREGLITNIQGKGCFVCPKDTELVREQLTRKIEGSLSAAIDTAKIAKLSREELHRLLESLLEENEYEERH
ncbi:MAG TPA: GntR family transcriptional regulator [Bacillota bacterium]